LPFFHFKLGILNFYLNSYQKFTISFGGVMVDISMGYLGLMLRSPVVASSSPLCRNIDNIKMMEDAGVGAVVLPSLFEEQIQKEQLLLNSGLTQGTEHFAEALSYLPDVGSYNFDSTNYLDLIRKAKRAVNIPVIGNLNGKSVGGWVGFSKEIEQAGADALELNIYDMPSDPEVTSVQIEENYIYLVKEIIKSVSIPVSVKIAPFFSSIPNFIKNIKEAGASGVVIFNRFYQPDIDLDNLDIKPVLHLSSSDELLLRIRWAGMLFGKIDIDIAITGGVHTLEDILKCIASGAKVSMSTSAILNKGISYIGELVEGIKLWLESHGYLSLSALHGVMSQRSVENPEAFERANYMRVLGSV